MTSDTHRGHPIAYIGQRALVDCWCPDCGSVRVKQHEGARPTWIRPGEDASVLAGGGAT